MTSHASTESGLFRAYWDEGLLDLLFGIALVGMGLGWETRLGAFAVLFAPLLTVFWVPLRQKIVEPRAGYVRFSQARRKENTHRLALTLTLGFGALALVLLATHLVRARGAGADLAHLVAGLPAVLVAIGAVLAGVLTGARRFHVYATALVAVAALTILLGQGPALPLVVGGVVVLLSASVLLTRFIRASRDYLDCA